MAREAHRRERGEQRNLPAPGGRSYGMARQCPRGHSSCKAREVAGVTPTNTTTAAQHGDDGTGAASSTRARSVSEAHTSTTKARARRRITRSPMAILQEIQTEAIRQERTRGEKRLGQIDRSARGGSRSVGDHGGGGR